MLLIILGTIEDSALAAEIALHFWYSVFVPKDHHLIVADRILYLIKHVNGDSFSMSLGQKSLINGIISKRTFANLVLMCQSDLQIGDASNEYHRIKFVLYRLNLFDLKLI